MHLFPALDVECMYLPAVTVRVDMYITRVNDVVCAFIYRALMYAVCKLYVDINSYSDV